MAFTTSDLDSLDAAIKSGERVVMLNGQSVTYRSVDDLIKARNFIADQIEGNTVGVKRRKQFKAFYAGRGYE